MGFYGVGTRFGGTDPFLNDCIKYDFWCMGDSEMKYYDIYKLIKVGDIIVAKRYYTKKSECRNYGYRSDWNCMESRYA